MLDETLFDKNFPFLTISEHQLITERTRLAPKPCSLSIWLDLNNTSKLSVDVFLLLVLTTVFVKLPPSLLMTEKRRIESDI